MGGFSHRGLTAKHYIMRGETMVEVVKLLNRAHPCAGFIRVYALLLNCADMLKIENVPPPRPV